MTRANRTVTQVPCRNGRRDVTSEPFPDADATVAVGRYDGRDRVRTPLGSSVESHAGATGRFAGGDMVVGRR